MKFLVQMLLNLSWMSVLNQEIGTQNITKKPVKWNLTMIYLNGTSPFWGDSFCIRVLPIILAQHCCNNNIIIIISVNDLYLIPFFISNKITCSRLGKVPQSELFSTFRVSLYHYGIS